MRFDREDATYLSEDWGGLAGLVSQDGDFPFHELSEDAMTRLYEAGCWWSSASVRERPGVRKFLGEIRRSERPYLLVQELRDGYCEVSLRDYLLGSAASSVRGGPSFLVETGLHAFELWPGGGGDTFTMGHALLLCRRTLQLVREEKLRVERLPSHAAGSRQGGQVHLPEEPGHGVQQTVATLQHRSVHPLRHG